ncbi:hypothetical protein RRF57_007985 [Xylaria bambusicola]|uniref:Uncharacterized protein n=1 Tax=Xylaria bambusicola TaxID=326684 RepID=A0AAN7ZAR2_9PEZI
MLRVRTDGLCGNRRRARRIIPARREAGEGEERRIIDRAGAGHGAESGSYGKEYYGQQQRSRHWRIEGRGYIIGS